MNDQGPKDHNAKHGTFVYMDKWWKLLFINIIKFICTCGLKVLKTCKVCLLAWLKLNLKTALLE